ncbi:RNA-directed DNA polymerase [Streptomyces sp. DI166]|uniref:group II intron reverse transcriptase/maturase n=1 Tax=Streptomyces sp. DI166 TaxID=1839783 RepID=UPI0007F42C4D|nr:group II intron reverse transcriptase/maturase [Streptomyces sp. DI166]SBT90759.1 RNA-directed DNA polymerase [Streptomyces sp. DI166]
MTTKEVEAVSPAPVNGPEDYAETWHSTEWAKVEASVRRLRQRIFTAAKEGDLKRVRNLQKLMLRSHSNTLVSVKRVTQQSQGRRTAGVDRETILTPRGRGMVAAQISAEIGTGHAQPVRRVYIPKANGKQRPLGIPVVRDRIRQARVKNALEPEWEARFEHRSYGFRPGRGCHDAIAQIFNVASKQNARRLWVLDADLTAAFDRISHDHLMDSLGLFPARDAVRSWLRAGVLDRGRFAPTVEGAPQGGVISPLLLNIALHGMESAAGHLTVKNGRTKPGAPVLIRYADDFAVFCLSEEEAHRVKEDLVRWMQPRGVSFNEGKTSVVHLDEGFDFLGFNIRRYNGKLLIKPSKDAVKRVRGRLRTEMLAMRGSNSGAVIKKLNPIIKGWATYYRTVVSKKTFQSLDDYVWLLTYKWGKHTHPKKAKSWVVDRYFGQFNSTRQDRWVFGDRDTGLYLYKFNWVKIDRHAMVKGGNSPDDPQLARYWANRRRGAMPSTADRMSVTLAARQKGICPLCKQPLISGAEYEPDSPREWAAWFSASMKPLHKHHFVYRRDGGSDESTNLRLVHAECHRQHHAGDHRKAAEACPSTVASRVRLSRMRG